jgi:hypothetical protein
MSETLFFRCAALLMFNIELESKLLAPNETTSVGNNKTGKERERGKGNKKAVLWLSINFFSINNPKLLQIVGEE